MTIVDQRPQHSVALIPYSSCVFLEKVDCPRMSKVLLEVLWGPMLIMLALSLFKIKHGDMCLAAEGVLGVFTLWSLPYICSNRCLYIALPAGALPLKGPSVTWSFRRGAQECWSIQSCLCITPFITVTVSRAKHIPSSKWLSLYLARQLDSRDHIHARILLGFEISARGRTNSGLDQSASYE